MHIDPKDLDDALEYAAQLIEELLFSDLCGIHSKRKRDREDAALRIETIKTTRKECAAHIRAFKSRPDLNPINILRHLAELPPESRQHDLSLTDAWPLAWKGWVDIEYTMICNSNSVPPECRYRVVLTEKGRSILNGSQKQ